MRVPNGVAPSVAALALGYVFGALPSADIASSLASTNTTDLRHSGSANPGALNAGMTLGKKWGAVVLVADVAKGVGASAVGRALVGANGANIAATAAVAGHCYPPGRTGGKGVSTSIGQVIGTFPIFLPLDMAVAAVTVALPKWTQRTWAATASASIAWVSTAVLTYRKAWSTGLDAPAPRSLPIAAAISSAIIAKRFLDTPLVDGKPSPPKGVPDKHIDKKSEDDDRSVHRFEQPAERERGELG